jgi:hypothetical protein
MMTIVCQTPTTVVTLPTALDGVYLPLLSDYYLSSEPVMYGPTAGFGRSVMFKKILE